MEGPERKEWRGQSAGLPFVKMSGAGNDFVIVDDRELAWAGREGALALALCPRGRSVGADGLILVRHSDRADARMLYLNADGREAALCGNGGRCLARYLHRTGQTGPRLTLETGGGRVLAAEVGDDWVRLEMAPVSWPPRELQAGEFAGSLITVGVPHFVHFLSAGELERLDVEHWGRVLRHHPLFAPEGANANFAARQDGEANTLAVRTFERGVEGETLACGTGCAAAALLAAREFGLAWPLRCHTRGGPVLTIHLEGGDPPPGRVMLEGEARWIYSGLADPGILPL